jgi:hypothetical protein
LVCPTATTRISRLVAGVRLPRAPEITEVIAADHVIPLWNDHGCLGRSGAEYRRRAKAGASRSGASPLLFANLGHVVLADTLQAIRSKR